MRLLCLETACTASTVLRSEGSTRTGVHRADMPFVSGPQPSQVLKVQGSGPAKPACGEASEWCQNKTPLGPSGF